MTKHTCDWPGCPATSTAPFKDGWGHAYNNDDDAHTPRGLPVAALLCRKHGAEFEKIATTRHSATVNADGSVSYDPVPDLLVSGGATFSPSGSIGLKIIE